MQFMHVPKLDNKDDLLLLAGIDRKEQIKILRVGKDENDVWQANFKKEVKPDSKVPILSIFLKQ